MSNIPGSSDHRVWDAYEFPLDPEMYGEEGDYEWWASKPTIDDWTEPEEIVDAQSEPQRRYLETPADVCLYGGTAGAGKTWALVWDPLRWVHYEGFTAVIFRRTFPQITAPGGLWDEAYRWYPLLGGKPQNALMEWNFKPNATIKFSQLQYEKNIYDWQGAQIAYLAFDELTHFTEEQWWYLFSRNRSTSGVRPYIRASANADAEHWAADFIQWWWDPETGYPLAERSGVLRYFTRLNGEIIWSSDPEELKRKYGHKTMVKSFTFIPGTLEDNRILMEMDPGYEANLHMLPPLEQERLLKGNWKIKAEAGKVFHRGWFKITTEIPRGGITVRYWDFASTKVDKLTVKRKPDFTASVLMRYVRGRYYILEVDWFQEDPAETDKRFRHTKEDDIRRCQADGSQYLLRWEMEGGSAGKRDNHRLITEHSGMDARGVPVSGDKFVRSRPLAIQAHGGNVSLEYGIWNEQFLRHMHSQPAEHDDIHDAAAGAFQTLVREKGRLGNEPIAPERLLHLPTRRIRSR